MFLFPSLNGLRQPVLEVDVASFRCFLSTSESITKGIPLLSSERDMQRDMHKKQQQCQLQHTYEVVIAYALLNTETILILYISNNWWTDR